MPVAAGRESPAGVRTPGGCGQGESEAGGGLGRTGSGGTPRSSERCPALLPNFGEEPRGEAAASDGCERAGE